MTKAKRNQRARPFRAQVGSTSAPGGVRSSGRNPPPRSAEARPPKTARPIAAAGRANIAPPVGQKAGETKIFPENGAGVGSTGAGSGRGPELTIGIQFVDRLRVAGGRGVEGLVADRERTHGAFAVQARTAQAIKQAYREGANWKALSDGQKQALEANADKVARILSGDADHPDHWDDLAGYATLGRGATIAGSWRRT